MKHAKKPLCAFGFFILLFCIFLSSCSDGSGLISVGGTEEANSIDIEQPSSEYGRDTDFYTHGPIEHILFYDFISSRYYEINRMSQLESHIAVLENDNEALKSDNEALKSDVEELKNDILKLEDIISSQKAEAEMAQISLNVNGLYQCNTKRDAVFESVSELYDAYDEFLSQKNVSKKLIGYASKADGSPDENLPIYSYTIGNAFSGDIADAPEILLTSGIHGCEKNAVMGLYLFIESLFDKSNMNAAALRNSLCFVVVPCINPWGYNNNVRYNARDVDLNRNFGNNWKSKSSEYGKTVYSELETQAMKSWLQEHSCAVLHFDIHNHSYLSETHCFYIATDSEKQKKLFSATVRNISDHVRSRYGIDLSSKNHFVEGNTISGVCAESYVYYGIDGGIIETPTWRDNSALAEKYITATADLIGNYIIEAVKNIRY